MTSILTDELVRIVFGRPSAPVVVAYTDSSARTSNALAIGTTYRFLATTNCHIDFGNSSNSATTSSTPLAAWIPEYFTMDAAYYVAAIRNSISGSLFISVMNKRA